MEDSPLPLYSRKTTLQVKIVDLAANIGIKVGGMGVILAVLGLIVFIFMQMFPLLESGEAGELGQPLKLSADRALLVHCDEYRRVGLRINESGTIVIFSLPTGEVIREEKPALLADATLTGARISLRPRSQAKVDGVQDVPMYHLQLGTSDGRLLIGTVAYVTDFLRYENSDEEPDELEKLHMPTEDEFKAVEYMPETLVYWAPKDKAAAEAAEKAASEATSKSKKAKQERLRDEAIRRKQVVEHLTSFGFYRGVHAVVEVTRAVDFKSDGKPIRAFGGAINEAPATEDRNAIDVVVTGDGRTLLARQKSEVNPMTDEVEISTQVDDLTERISGTPDFVLVNDRMLRVVLANKAGLVHVFEWDPLRKRFAMPYPAFSVFAPQQDLDENRHWRDLVNDQRVSAGFEPSTEALTLTAMNYLIGDQTVIFADSRGGLQAWFAVPGADESSPRRLTRARTHRPSKTPVIQVGASPVNKGFLAVEASGHIRAINNTGSREFLEMDTGGAVTACMARKGDGILVVGTDGAVHHWWVDAPHSEASFATLFGKVWYEDFKEPGYEWQTTSGTDDTEPKINLIPLVSGTVKGAIYALLFSVPLAVLAAIYTSEFMHRNLRSVFKPTMEVMASLPSVVLGFLAALYFAPKAAPMMTTILCALVIVPAVFMVFGWLWQRCPPSFIGKFGHWRSTTLLFVLLFTGIFLSSVIGPRAETVLFPATEGANPSQLDPVTFQPLTEAASADLDTGSFRTWTDGGKELPRPTEVNGMELPQGWWIPGGHSLLVVLMTLPLALLLGFGAKKVMAKLPKKDKPGPIETLRGKLEGEYKGGLRAVAVDALFSLVLASILLGGGLLLAMLLSHPIEWMFFSYDHPTAGRVADFRRWITGPEGWKFEQSNSMIVGFAMGFAVIPIIYTIAEDALNTVPNQLRAASLACGASRWQTTMRVVMPAAVAGIFSGIVIGLGRALGETMIVVMAAGGTPVTDFQPLSGFRSLAAAIAIEMPEAPHGGTLYRTLFLAGFLLFCMTFVINTLAEGVRIRLRKKLSRL